MERKILSSVAFTLLTSRNVLQFHSASFVMPPVIYGGNSKFIFSCGCGGDDSASSKLKLGLPSHDVSAGQSNHQSFSVFSRDAPSDRNNTWILMAMYMLNLHIPFGVGGLSIASYILHKPSLDPQTQALSLLVFQIIELTGSLLLLKSNSSHTDKRSAIEGRNWILASAVGLLAVVTSVFFISVVDEALGFKEESNYVLKEMLSSSAIGGSACVTIYCFVTPLLEELIYRRFLLKSLSSSMSWQKAVIISSVAFSAAHFSLENFGYLLAIGCVLGCCYCWTGRLVASFSIHSLYNALILIISFLS